MHGLVAYDDDSQSDTETPIRNDKELKMSHKSSTDLRRTGKSQIIIKRPSNIHKNHPRAPLLEHLKGSTSSEASSRHQSQTHDRSGSDDRAVGILPERTPDADLTPGRTEDDDIDRIRTLLRPPPIPGVDDWGIPGPSTKPCDPATKTKLSQFSALKHDPHNPKHFNDSLMSNRSFRNPHLYAKLVEFVDVDERVTNFPKDIWDPEDVQEDWFADKIAERQRFRAEQQATAQTSGKRTQVAFTSSASSASSTSALPPPPPPPSLSSIAPRGQRGGERDARPSYGYGGGRDRGKYDGQSSGVLGGGKRPNRYQPYGSSGQQSYSNKSREGEKAWYG